MGVEKFASVIAAWLSVLMGEGEKKELSGES